MYLIGTDGLCKNNQAQGGQKGTWAFIVMDLQHNVLGGKAGHDASTTNNAMELTAVLEALRWADKHKAKIHLLTDSQYVYNTITQWAEGWKKRGWRKSDGSAVANLSVVKELMELYNPHLHTLEWVRGHQISSDWKARLNNAADVRCNEEYINKFI